MADDHNDTNIGPRDPILAGVLEITVKQGDVSQVFYIADSLLQSKAQGFLDEPETSAWVWRTPNNLTITNIEIPTLRLFVEWLNGTTMEDVPYEKQSWHKLTPIIKLYMLGERFDVSELCTEALHHLSKFFGAHLADLNLRDPFTRKLITASVAQEEVKLVYDSTELGSRLRTIFVEHFCAMDLESSCTAAALCEYPKEFLVDVMLMRAKLNGFLRGVGEAARRLKKWQREEEEEADSKFYDSKKDEVGKEMMDDGGKVSGKNGEGWGDACAWGVVSPEKVVDIVANGSEKKGDGWSTACARGVESTERVVAWGG